MCKTEELPPRADSPYSSGGDSNNFDYEDWSDATPPGRDMMMKEGLSSFVSDNGLRKQGRLSWFLPILAGTAVAAAISTFARWFPFVVSPEASAKTYDWAFFSYDPRLSHFDNTIWTYGTDYTLALITSVLAFTILRQSRRGVSDGLCSRSALLLLGYGISTAAGGYCHHFYTTLESRNSLSFRLLWTLCVGTVTSASCSMGASGTEVVRQFQRKPNCHPLLRQMPLIPESFWWTFGLLNTAVCAWGGLSFQRPACDIFVAGITQAPSTFYLMIFFSLVKHSKVHFLPRCIGFVGFILNAPLLPMYPLLIHHTDWTLASVNTLLHCWLCVAWSMQGYSLLHVSKALVADQEERDTRARFNKNQ